MCQSLVEKGDCKEGESCWYCLPHAFQNDSLKLFGEASFRSLLGRSKAINTLLLELTASLTVLQELNHFSEAARDLEQALELEPANMAFAKELERLKQDCAEQRKQRTVLKQLHNVNSQSSNASAASTAKQITGEQQGRSFSAGEPVNDLQRVQQLMQALHTAGMPHSNLLLEKSFAAADAANASWKLGCMQSCHVS